MNVALNADATVERLDLKPLQEVRRASRIGFRPNQRLGVKPLHLSLLPATP
jgi:hypothetical protein